MRLIEKMSLTKSKNRFVPHIVNLNAEKQALLNTPGGVFKHRGLPYAFHIHHRKAVHWDEVMKQPNAPKFFDAVVREIECHNKKTLEDHTYRKGT
jgi:hypothetical protein